MVEQGAKYSVMEKEQEDLLVCLAEQDMEMNNYRERLKVHGEVFDDEDDEEEFSNLSAISLTIPEFQSIGSSTIEIVKKERKIETKVRQPRKCNKCGCSLCLGASKGAARCSNNPPIAIAIEE